MSQTRLSLSERVRLAQISTHWKFADGRLMGCASNIVKSDELIAVSYVNTTIQRIGPDRKYRIITDITSGTEHSIFKTTLDQKHPIYQLISKVYNKASKSARS